ncbi:MAG: hypothetical protein AB1626_04855, partial [Candidatus Micrarchaeota archaeon]
ALELYNHEMTFINTPNSCKANIANKTVFMFFDRLLGVSRGAEKKEVPEIVLNVDSGLQKQFLQAYFAGDYGVTVSKKLASDLLYVLLQNGVLASIHETPAREVVFADGHVAHAKTAYSVVEAPRKLAEFKTTKRYAQVPLLPFRNDFLALHQPNHKGRYRADRQTKRIAGSCWLAKKVLRKNVALRLRWLAALENPLSAEQFAKAFCGRTPSRIEREQYRVYLERLVRKGLADRAKAGGNCFYRASTRASEILGKMKTLEKLLSSDLAFVKVLDVKRTPSSKSLVYDLSVPGCENFAAGFGGVMCHNSRFDLIFPIRDVLDETHDRKVAEHILVGHKLAAEKEKPKEDSPVLPAIPIDFLRKYIAYARKNVFPILSPEAGDKIKEFYLEMRRMGRQQNNFPITARYIEGIIRLTEASAKARLSPVAEVQDAERAIALQQFVLKEVFMDKETGRIDSDIISIGQPKSKIDKMRTVLSIIGVLEKKFDQVDIDDVVKDAGDAAIDESTCRRIIDDLLRQGELFSPKPGYVKNTTRSKD